ncbi:protein PSK SIMULATOR 3 [Impatiens glandulifera]|uniref:protein PSK SIMULATOR 3 n=1 Tax=Impatiens glandulifera TaxID=253017 RepID=UPI001FB04D04|nr:protein PSK SIMULATOR 3 [Impatiens glandulifera]
MVAQPSFLKKMGNQVSSNLKHTFLAEPTKRTESIKHPVNRETIGILSFEVANVISKTVHLHKSVTDREVSKLKNEIFKSQGMKYLISSDESYLLELTVAEKLDDLNRVAGVISRLGKKCSLPALQGFEHVFGDLVSGAINVRALEFLVKDMEAMVKKMERYVSSTAKLYNELAVLDELEQALKKFQLNQHEESRKVFEQKLMWQKQDVRHLKNISLWNQSYDKVVELLARTICTVYVRIRLAFGDAIFMRESSPGCSVSPSEFNDGVSTYSSRTSFRLGAVERAVTDRTVRNSKMHPSSRRPEVSLFRAEDFNFACGTGPGRLFMECISLSSSISEDDEEENDMNRSPTSGCCKWNTPNSASVLNRDHIGTTTGSFSKWNTVPNANASVLSPKGRLSKYALSSTVGGSALALHYANVVMIIEKLLRYPHLIGEEARDDLYQMLPSSLRMSLKTKLKSYLKSLAIFDAPLAHDWKEKLDNVLNWLAPLAHNMIRWQSERNFEQQQIVSRTNVLLLQTLYFADRKKTEEAICQLLVGLNYICRYEHQQTALLDCSSSFDFDNCTDWQIEDHHHP